MFLAPPFNEAVALEKLANYPRVILDGQLLDYAELRESVRSATNITPNDSISSLVAEDFDGLCYIDYINVHPLHFGDDWPTLREYFLSLRRVIEMLGRERSADIQVKRSWLIAKYNAMSVRLRETDFREFGGQIIPDEEAELFHEIRPF